MDVDILDPDKITIINIYKIYLYKTKKLNYIVSVRRFGAKLDRFKCIILFGYSEQATKYQAKLYSTNKYISQTKPFV